MALYLVQHGISSAKEVDPEKGLAAEGLNETHRIAEVAKHYKIGVKSIVHSGKKRAYQTAEIFHSALQIREQLLKIAGIAPMDDVTLFAATVDAADNRMVVGHMPFMQRLVSYLTTGDENNRVYQFQNSGIVCLDTEEGEQGEQNWFIKWTLNPNIE